MTIPAVDSTTLTNLSPNLDVGDVADPALRLAAFQYIYTELQTIVTELNSIPTANLQNLAVTSAKLNDLAVITGKIADLAVTTAKINDAAVTLAKMATASVGTSQLVDLSVTTAKIANAAVGVAQLSPGAQVNESVNNALIVALKADVAQRGIDVLYPPASLVAAVGDGTTDDTAAIQAMIDYADAMSASVGAEIFFPRKNFYIAGSLQFRRYTTLRGDRATITYGGTGTAIKAEGSSTSYIYPRMTGINVIKLNSDYIGTGLSVKYARVNGGFIDCSFSGFQYGVYHSDSVGFAWLNTFDRCLFQNNKYGVKCDINSNNVAFRTCKFLSNTDYAAWVLSSIQVGFINGCDFESNGNKTTGHAIYVDNCRAVTIQGNYFENNGFNDANSAFIHIGANGASNYSFQPTIIGNYFKSSGKYTAIKIVECQTCYISGNDFYDGDAGFTYDIDIATMSTLNFSFIMGNRPSGSGNAKLNYAAIATNAWVQHGDYLRKQTIELVGNNTSFIWHDDTNTSTGKIDHLNDKLRVWNKSAANYFIFNGATKQVSAAIESGTTAQRPASPWAIGYQYFDTTLGKPIWWSGTVWKDATGTTV